jgi:DHA3 family macrolide efflux protein-like MFS transporter
MAETTASMVSEKFTLRSLLGIRSFRLIWSGQVVSDFGDSMTRLALLLLINELTGSITAMATLTIVLMVPRLLFGFVAGVYVDRLDRKRIMVISDILRGSLVLGFILVDSPQKIWIIYLIGFLQGSVATFFEPSRTALLPELIPHKSLLAANTITQTSQIIFYMLGNAAAGVAVGIMHTYEPVFIINALTFYTSALLVSRLVSPDSTRVRGASMTARIMLGQLWEGLRISLGNRVLSGTIVAYSLTMLGIGAVNVLMVPLMINELKVPETLLGATSFGQSAGMILGGIFIVSMATRFKATKLTAVGLIGFGFFTALLSTSQNVWHIVAIIFMSALFLPPITASTQTILQVAVPNELRGRTNAARLAFTMTANLASMGAAGLLADRIGIRNVFIIGGAFAALGGLAASFMYRGVALNLADPPRETLIPAVQPASEIQGE